MSQHFVPIPKEVFSGLDLQEGDVIEGRTRNAWVEVRVLWRGRGEGVPLTDQQFVERWRGKFRDVAMGVDPRLEAVLNKHVKPG